MTLNWTVEWFYVSLPRDTSEAQQTLSAKKKAKKPRKNFINVFSLNLINMRQKKKIINCIVILIPSYIWEIT